MPKVQLTRISVIFLFLAVLFLMGVFIALMCGAQLPCGAARNVFIILVGFLVAGMWWFLGAKAEGEGHIPLLPSMKFKLSGGIVGFLVGCGVAHLVYSCPEEPGTFLRIESAREYVSEHASRRPLEVTYTAQHLASGAALLLEMTAGSTWEGAQRTAGLEAGENKKVLTAFSGAAGTALRVRLVVKPGPDGHRPPPSEPELVSGP